MSGPAGRLDNSLKLTMKLSTINFILASVPPKLKMLTSVLKSKGAYEFLWSPSLSIKLNSISNAS